MTHKTRNRVLVVVLGFLIGNLIGFALAAWEWWA